MPITITWPTDQDRELVNAIRTAIGRPVRFWLIGSQVTCSSPGCALDPVTNTSTNSLCPICSGEYYITTYSGVDINAHITWGFNNLPNWVTGGQFVEGECRIQIEHTLTNVTIVDTAKWVTVDGKEMRILNKIPRGVQSLNRILIDLDQKE